MAEIRRVGVVGAGTMGNGIAHVFARSGLSVVLAEVEQVALDRGLGTVEKNLAREVANRVAEQFVLTPQRGVSCRALHHRFQVLGGEGLGEKISRSELHGADVLLLLTRRGRADNWNDPAESDDFSDTRTVPEEDPR